MLDARTVTGRRISVVDVFRVLSLLPRCYFRRPDADLTGVVRQLARIQVSGTAARRRRNRQLAHRHLDRLARVYGELVTGARLVSPHSWSWRTTATAICSRAERHHVSLRAYRRAQLVPRIRSLVRGYSSHGRQFPRAVQAFFVGILARNPVEGPRR
jgi:hypothetical protein